MNDCESGVLEEFKNITLDCGLSHLEGQLYKKRRDLISTDSTYFLNFVSKTFIQYVDKLPKEDLYKHIQKTENVLQPAFAIEALGIPFVGDTYEPTTDSLKRLIFALFENECY